MLKVQEFFCEDCLTEADFKDALLYASTHNCVCKLIFYWDDIWWYEKEFEYVFPDDTYEIACKRLYNKSLKEKKQYEYM